VEQAGEQHVPALLCPEQAAAADAFQRPLRFRFRARLSRSVGRLVDGPGVRPSVLRKLSETSYP
jgi:hypothetical protein